MNEWDKEALRVAGEGAFGSDEERTVGGWEKFNGRYDFEVSGERKDLGVRT